MRTSVVSLIIYNFESELYSHTFLLCYQCTDIVECFEENCGFTNGVFIGAPQCGLCTVGALANTVICATNTNDPSCGKYYYLLF